MKTKSQIIEELIEMGDRFAFSLLDGTALEGYIIETEEGYFVFESGGPMAPDEPEHIKYNDVDFSTLSYLDSNDRRYKDAIWDEYKNEWVINNSQ